MMNVSERNKEELVVILRWLKKTLGEMAAATNDEEKLLKLNLDRVKILTLLSIHAEEYIKSLNER